MLESRKGLGREREALYTHTHTHTHTNMNAKVMCAHLSLLLRTNHESRVDRSHLIFCIAYHDENIETLYWFIFNYDIGNHLNNTLVILNT